MKILFSSVNDQYAPCRDTYLAENLENIIKNLHVMTPV